MQDFRPEVRDGKVTGRWLARRQFFPAVREYDERGSLIAPDDRYDVIEGATDGESAVTIACEQDRKAWDDKQKLRKRAERRHKHSTLWKATNREHRKLEHITKAIREARAESLFGVGVKLAASQCFEAYDVCRAAEDALEEIDALAGTDFMAIAGEYLEYAA